MLYSYSKFFARFVLLWLMRLILLLANFLLNRLEKSSFESLARSSANLADDETFKQHQLYDKSKMHWLGRNTKQKLREKRMFDQTFCKTFLKVQKWKYVPKVTFLSWEVSYVATDDKWDFSFNKHERISCNCLQQGKKISRFLSLWKKAIYRKCCYFLFQLSSWVICRKCIAPKWLYLFSYEN